MTRKNATLRKVGDTNTTTLNAPANRPRDPGRQLILILIPHLEVYRVRRRVD